MLTATTPSSLRATGSTTGNYTISTFAGTGSSGYSNSYGYSSDNIPATSAKLNKPSGLSLDSYNNLYIADNYNNRIRMVSRVSSGGGGNVITTIAGTGMAGTQVKKMWRSNCGCIIYP